MSKPQCLSSYMVAATQVLPVLQDFLKACVDMRYKYLL